MTKGFSVEPWYADQLDMEDPLASFKARFFHSDPEQIYMDGNSLGRLAKDTIDQVNEVVQGQWGRGLIRSWNENWYRTPQRVGEKIARLAGAAPGQVIVADSTSVNLFKLTMAALHEQEGRAKIISDEMNFPSDLYVLQGCIRLLGNRHRLHLVPSKDTVCADLDVLYDAIDEDTALLTLSHVVFKSGFLYDAAEITRRAHKFGALVLWDLSHSIGAVPILLDHWGIDLAIGCTYKYLNGGPGAPAFLYVREALQERMLSPIWGWFGQRSPFAFELEYQPAAGIDRFLCGTPPILSLLAMEPGLDLILQAGMDEIRAKSSRLTAYLVDLFDALLTQRGFSLGSPREPDQRGSHISIRHPEGFRINRAMIEKMNVIPDFRTPDNIRLGLSPLYTSFSDIREAVERICRIMDEKIYLQYPLDRPEVT